MASSLSDAQIPPITDQDRGAVLGGRRLVASVWLRGCLRLRAREQVCRRVREPT